jgi:hypothetical protein
MGLGDYSIGGFDFDKFKSNLHKPVGSNLQPGAPTPREATISQLTNSRFNGRLIGEALVAKSFADSRNVKDLRSSSANVEIQGKLGQATRRGSNLDHLAA